MAFPNTIYVFSIYQIVLCFYDPEEKPFKSMVIHGDRTHSSLTNVHCFGISYVEKQPVAWKNYCVEYWLKKLQKNMDRCTDHCDITEILLKMTSNTILSISQFKSMVRLRIKLVSSIFSFSHYIFEKLSQGQ